jgi:omega-6 fatty acid desaturase (delta-12 desaturase)
MPQPSVSELRAAFEPDSKRRSFVTGLALFTGISILCLGAFATVTLADQLWLKLALSIILGVLISVLFVIGHDACHDSLSYLAKPFITRFTPQNGRRQQKLFFHLC